MNTKDLVVVVGLALMTTWFIQYFFFNKYWGKENNEAVYEQSFVAPKVKQEFKPLNLEVDFIDVKRPIRATLSDIETEWGKVTFSTDAASLESIEFNHPASSKKDVIRTIFPVSTTEREDRCFLIGLEKKTPYYYQLVERKDGDESVQLVYEARFDGNIISKTFIVYNKKHKIDLILKVSPKEGTTSGLEPRIFYPSPIMPSIVKTDVISSIVIDQSGTFEMTNRKKLDIQRGWFGPTLFGAGNHYFVQALVEDTDNFIQRAYYKLEGHEKIFSILEGPIAKTPTTWMMSFYFGPKEHNAMIAVDGRLEQTLAYSGLLAPISKLLLLILQWLYSYLHNYGLAIIILTCMFRLLLLPLTMHSTQKMEQQREIQKKITYLQKKYKNDPARIAQERNELVRKYGMPGLGCILPLLLQMPIFFALSRILNSAIELYQAPMLWIPDLSAKDPYYILPILVGGSLLMQAMQSGDAQQQTSGLVMALIFGAVAANFSAGLALYFLISTLLGIAQTRMVKYLKIVK